MRNFILLFICILLYACSSSPIEKVLEIKENVSVYPFSLKHQVREAIKDGDKKVPALIMLHGLNSNENDLMPLARAIDKRICVVSVQAPLSDEPNSHKWFSMRFDGNKIICNDAQVERSRLVLKQFLEEAIVAYNLDPQNIVMMGFSQGGIMAYQFSISTPHLIKGSAILSSYVLESNKLKIGKIDDLKNLKMFISHGKEDNVIPYQKAVESMRFLENINIPFQFKLYPVAHTISEQNLIDVVNWLEDVMFDKS